MRLPVLKPWRAFPALDPYTDQQCKRFLADAHKSQKRLMAFSNLAIVAVIVGGVVLWIVAIPVISTLFLQRFGLSMKIAVAFAPVAALPVVVMAISRRTSRVLLLRELGRWRDAGLRECPQCRYPLVELPERDRRKTCPECGYVVELAAPTSTA